MKTCRFTRYFVRIAGESGHFTDSGWSGYNRRLSERDQLKTARERNAFQVYGPEQCAAHIAELRRHKWDGTRPWKRATFEIVRETTVQRVITTADIS